jgi:hypothetical protein
MIEILEAIALKVSSTPALTSGLAGGFHLNHPGEGTTMPFAVLTPISAPLQYNTSRTYLQPVSMQISIFAATVGEIATLIKAYRDAFNRQALTLASGKVMSPSSPMSASSTTSKTRTTLCTASITSWNSNSRSSSNTRNPRAQLNRKDPRSHEQNPRHRPEPEPHGQLLPTVRTSPAPPTSCDQISKTITDTLATGTAIDCADRIYRATRTLAATTGEDLDLAGSLTDCLRRDAHLRPHQVHPGQAEHDHGRLHAPGRRQRVGDRRDRDDQPVHQLGRAPPHIVIIVRADGILPAVGAGRDGVRGDRRHRRPAEDLQPQRRVDHLRPHPHRRVRLSPRDCGDRAARRA